MKTIVWTTNIGLSETIIIYTIPHKLLLKIKYNILEPLNFSFSSLLSCKTPKLQKPKKTWAPFVSMKTTFETPNITPFLLVLA